MKVRLEYIPPIVADCDFYDLGERIQLIRKHDKKVCAFPAEAREYLKLIISGNSLQTIVNMMRKRGTHIDFLRLKNTLLDLYWAGFLKNANDFRPAIEYPEWRPTAQAALKTVFFEIDIDSESPSLQPFLFLIPALFAVYFIFLPLSGPLPQWQWLLFILTFPMSFLTLKSLAWALISSWTHRKPMSLSLHFSWLGVYLDESTIKSSPATLIEISLRVAVLGFAFYYFNGFAASTQVHIVERYIPLCLFLIFSQMTAPGRVGVHSDLIRILHSKEYEKMGSTVASLIYFAVTALNITCLFAFAMFAASLNLDYFSIREVNIEPGFILNSLSMFFSLFLAKDFWTTAIYLRSQITHTDFLPFKNKSALLAKGFSKDELVELLKKTAPFSMLEEKVLRQVARFSDAFIIPAGIRVIKQDAETDDLYILVEGKVGVYKHVADNKQKHIIDLVSGNIFGEGGFFLGQKRSADVLTQEKSLIVRITKPACEELTNGGIVKEGLDFQKRIWALQTLMQSKLFFKAPHEVLMSLVSKAEVHILHPGTRVMSEGEAPDSVWVIIEGECMVSYRSQHLRTLGPKTLFGEIGILWNTRRGQDVTVSAPSLLLKISGETIWQTLESDIDIAIALQELGNQRNADNSRAA